MRRKPQSGSKQKKQLKRKNDEAWSDRRLILVFGHKDKKNIIQELKELEGVKELRHMFGGESCDKKMKGLKTKI